MTFDHVDDENPYFLASRYEKAKSIKNLSGSFPMTFTLPRKYGRAFADDGGKFLYASEFNISQVKATKGGSLFLSFFPLDNLFPF